MLYSSYMPLAQVSLPYQERQMYMHTFDLANPVMAPGFEDYLEPVLKLVRAAGALVGMAHMTVDEKRVKKGHSQRRPKPHVDGRYSPVRAIWGHTSDGWTHGEQSGSWGHSSSGWLHNCNSLGESEKFKRMSVIVASSVPGCRAWKGEFDTEPASDGDLSHFEFGEGEILEPNFGYLLSPDCVHESMLMDRDVDRTFLRIALPVEFEFSR